MLHKMTIGSRLVLSFSLILVFIAGIGIGGYWGIGRMDDYLKVVGASDAKKVEYAQRSRANINMLRRYEKDVLLNMQDPAKVKEYTAKWQEALEHCDQRIKGLEQLAESAAEKEKLSEISRDVQRYATGFRAFLDSLASGKISTLAEAQQATAALKDSSHDAEAKIADFAAAADKAMAGVLQEAEARSASIKGTVLALVVAAFLLTLALTAIITRSITRPLAAVDEMVRDIAHGEGDLTKRLDYAGKDELGAICGSFNTFLEKLQDIIRRVTHNAVQVATAANQLTASADQIATGSEEVAAQAGAVASAMEMMAETSGEIARNCQLAAEGGDRATEAANTGEGVVQNTVAVMGRLAEQVHDTAETVGKLGSRSDQIGAIVGTIQDIADQTNLLALNAAIEAARAGEQGRGFAVVADEVRALAERTTKATREIGEMIKAIQVETKGAVTAMVEGVAQVREGSAEATRSGESLQHILAQISEVTAQVNQVAVAADEQSATTDEINSTLHQITEVMQSTARNAHDSADAASRLHALAEELRGLMGQFRVAA